MADETVVVEAPVVRGFEALSDPAFMGTAVATETNIGAPNAAAILAGETPATPITPLATTATPVTQVANADVIDPLKPAVVAEEEVIAPITAFSIPGVTPDTIVETPEQIAQKAAIAKLETEQSWTNLAATKGISLTEDTFDAYSKGLDTFYEQKEQASLEAVKKAGYDLELNKLPIEAVAVIEGYKAGLTTEEIFAPVKQIEALLALSNEELVAEDLRLQDWSEELIEKKIADLVENDKLDLEAQPLRVLLNNNKKVVAKNQVDKFAQMQQQRVEHEKQVRVSESETIKNTITSMKEYMGVPVDQTLVNYVTQKWNEGKYHEALRDPKKIADFIMNEEFGEQGKKALANREYQRGRDEKANKLHNIPPITPTGAVVNTTQTTQKPEGNWGALKR